ncbi:hypothetical protein TrST_g11871 [Triparma strigata]|uniref:Uncharacterized protein n=1 Tax=Triparma strigata TaxID=1606541 RepID=A0A9W7BF11_9STRA|nr:hypothetical protein TrST_g11871 [Triparma strigata]
MPSSPKSTNARGNVSVKILPDPTTSTSRATSPPPTSPLPTIATLRSTINNSISGLVPKKFDYAKKYVSVTKLALFAGAGLSFSDLLCDLVMIREYTKSGHQQYANATIAAVAVSLALQLLVVMITNAKMNTRRKLVEVLYVLTFVKPGVDVYRVTRGQKAKAGSRSNPFNEMMYIRTIELFAECIPSVLIQTIAFVDGSERAAAANLSLASSILTAAYIATSISIEKDANASSRRADQTSTGFYL